MKDTIRKIPRFRLAKLSVSQWTFLLLTCTIFYIMIFTFESILLGGMITSGREEWEPRCWFVVRYVPQALFVGSLILGRSLILLFCKQESFRKDPRVMDWNRE